MPPRKRNSSVGEGKRKLLGGAATGQSGVVGVSLISL